MEIAGIAHREVVNAPFAELPDVMQLVRPDERVCRGCRVAEDDHVDQRHRRDLVSDQIAVVEIEIGEVQIGILVDLEARSVEHLLVDEARKLRAHRGGNRR